MSVIPSSRLRLGELRAVERKERDQFETAWYDLDSNVVTGHQSRALREMLEDGLIELVPETGYLLRARITDKGRRTMADWESPVPIIYGTRPRHAALHAAVTEPLHYDGQFRHATGALVRHYLARPLADLLRAGLLSVREIPGDVTVTQSGLVHHDRWGAV